MKDKIKLHGKKIMAAILMLVVALGAFGVYTYLTDRNQASTTITTATFSKDGYTLTRTVDTKPIAFGDSITVDILESNEKEEKVKSSVKMSAEWIPVASDSTMKIWGNANESDNAVLTIDGKEIEYTVETDGTISFTLPEHELAEEAADVKRELVITVPAYVDGEDFDATGTISVDFTGVTVSQSPYGWSNEYSETEVNAQENLHFDVIVGWPVGLNSEDTTTGTNSIIAYMSVSSTDGMYGLIFTGHGEMMDMGFISGDFTIYTRPWNLYAYNIDSIVFSDRIISVGDYAFENMSALTGDLVFSENMKVLGENSFRKTNFNTVDLNQLFMLSDSTFEGCKSIIELTLSPNLTEIPYDCFKQNTSLKTINWGNSKIDTISGSAFGNATSLEELIIPNSVVTIDSYAFYNASSLTNLTLGNSVKTIGERAFENASALPEVTIPKSVTSISASAFRENNVLKDITFEDGFNGTIGSLAFRASSPYTSSNLLKTNVFTDNPDVRAYNWKGDYRWVKGEPILQYWTSSATTDFHAYKDTVTKVTFMDHYDLPDAVTAGPWDVSAAGDESVMAYMVGTEVYICSNVYTWDQPEKNVNAKVIANGRSSYMFYNFKALEEVVFDDFDSSTATNMTSMFEGCKKLTKPDTGELVTDGVTNMSYMFTDCSSLTTLSLTNFNTAKVEYFQYMFEGCSGLTTLDVSEFDTTKAAHMNHMFDGCKKVTTIDVSDWETPALKTMYNMFDGCNAVTELDLSGFDTDQVTQMNYVFYNCYDVQKITFGEDWDTSNVQYFNCMFSNCNDLQSIDLSRFDTSNATSMETMFYYCKTLTELDLSTFDTGKIATREDIRQILAGCNSLETLTIGKGIKDFTIFQAPYLNKLTTIIFNHDADDTVIMPDPAGKGSDGAVYTDGAFYVENYVETDVQTENDTIAEYDWVTDNRAKAEAVKGITVTYDANGGSFSNNDTINKVDYTKGTVVSKISKTSNVNDDGTSTNKAYGGNLQTTDVITIPGATSLDVTITYATEDPNWDWVCVYDNSVTPSYSNFDQSISGRLGGSTLTTKTYSVPGDTVQFFFRSDGYTNNFYGYYAVVSAKTSDEGMSVLSGAYEEPINSNELLEFKGWYTDINCSDGNEFDLNNLESSVTVYAKWGGPEPILQSWSRGVTTDFHAYKDTVTKITVVDHYDLPDGFDKTAGYGPWDVSEAQNGSVMAYMVGTDVFICSNVGSAADVIANRDSSNLFYSFKAVTEIDVAKLDTSRTNDMSWMFAYCSSLESLDLSSFNTVNTTTMNNMFYSSGLTSLNTNGWDTKNVKTMSRMFALTNFIELDLSHFDTSNVVDMSSIFYWCKSLEKLNVSNWNTSNVQYISQAFEYCESLKSLDVSKWQVNNVKSFYRTFYYCVILEDLNVSDWDTSNATDMSFMFTATDCVKLDLSNWNTENVVYMQEMFRYCSKLKELDVRNFDTSNVVDMSYMFYRTSSLESITLGPKWDRMVFLSENECPFMQWHENQIIYVEGKSSESDFVKVTEGWSYGATVVYQPDAGVQATTNVSIDANGGEVAMQTYSSDSSVVVEYGEVDCGSWLDLSDVKDYFIRDGFELIGFSTDANATTASFRVRIPNGKENVTLYAIWEEIPECTCGVLDAGQTAQGNTDNGDMVHDESCPLYEAPVGEEFAEGGKAPTPDMDNGEDEGEAGGSGGAGGGSTEGGSGSEPGNGGGSESTEGGKAPTNPDMNNGEVEGTEGEAGENGDAECNCGTTDGVHGEACPLYEAPDNSSSDSSSDNGSSEGEDPESGEGGSNDVYGPPEASDDLELDLGGNVSGGDDGEAGDNGSSEAGKDGNSPNMDNGDNEGSEPGEGGNGDMTEPDNGSDDEGAEGSEPGTDGSEGDSGDNSEGEGGSDDVYGPPEASGDLELAV